MDEPRRSAVRLTQRDRRLLSFAADHRLVLPAHVQALLGVSAGAAARRLRALAAGGYLQPRALLHQQPSAHLITGRGLAAIDSPLPRPRLDLRQYLHDVGVAWLWLAAARGRFGDVVEILSERQLRSRDGLPRERGPLEDPHRYGVRLWAFGAGGRERLHYPDLLLHTPDGQRVALELELSGKSQRRLEQIMTAYGAEPRIDAVLYLVDRPDVERAVRDAATGAGVSSRVHVQRFTWSDSMQRLAEQLSPTVARGAALAAPAGRRGVQRG